MGNSQTNNNNNLNNNKQNTNTAREIYNNITPNELSEVHSKTFNELKSKVQIANQISEKFKDEEGFQLYFSLIPNSEEENPLPLFWKYSVIIQATLINKRTKMRKGKAARQLNFKEFHKLFYFLLQLETLDDLEKDPTFRNNLQHDVFSTPSSPPEIEECIICMERVPNTVFHCAHAYCEQCANEWIKKSGECPMCRANISNDDSFFMMETPNSQSQISSFLKSFVTPKK